MTVPRTETPLGKLLKERGISARALGEAIAIREGRPRRIPTENVNQWLWGHKLPSSWRQQLICELLGVPPEDLFERKPPKRPRKPQTPGELRLVQAAAEGAPDPAEAARHLLRAVSQDTIPGPTGVVQSIDYRARNARARTKPPERKAA